MNLETVNQFLFKYKNIIIEKNYPWIEPHRNKNDFFNYYILEWWNKERKLSIYFNYSDNDITYIKIFPSNNILGFEMEDDVVGNFLDLYTWILNEKEKETTQ